ncbi:hypothetical protein KC19_1G116400, partial [Ceratodon purpureus]
LLTFSLILTRLLHSCSIKFYFVDVNTVLSSLGSRAGVTKMPTIQLGKNKEKAGKIIGGDQGWLLMDKIREMLTVKK